MRHQHEHGAHLDATHALALKTIFTKSSNCLTYAARFCYSSNGRGSAFLTIRRDPVTGWLPSNGRFPQLLEGVGRFFLSWGLRD
jgi:hypothetical protein